MKQYYRHSNLKSRLTLAAFLAAAIFLITLYYKNPDNIALTSLRRGATNAVAYVQLGANKVLQPVYNGWIYLVKLSRANQENAELKENLLGLKQRLSHLQVIQEENERLRKLVQLPARQKYKMLVTNIVGISSNNLEASIIIDKGTVKGVKNHLPAISQEGLIGQVVNAAASASQIQLITDTKSGVAAEVTTRGVKGLVQGTYDGGLEMILVKKTATVKKGDVVVTSGLGGVYPASLLIGRVRSVDDPPQALYKDIRIESQVDFNNLHEVLLIKSPLPPNVDEFE
jgi:rod shape-determining protein MreC